MLKEQKSIAASYLSPFPAKEIISLLLWRLVRRGHCFGTVLYSERAPVPCVRLFRCVSASVLPERPHVFPLISLFHSPSSQREGDAISVRQCNFSFIRPPHASSQLDNTWKNNETDPVAGFQLVLDMQQLRLDCASSLGGGSLL